MGKSDLRVIIGADASNFNKNIKAAQGQLIKFENVAKSVGSSIKTALVGAFAIDSAQRFFSTMIEAGRGFEDQMARVKAVSNASAKNFEMMRKEAARLGETTKYSARQAAAALENLVRNGLSATKATKALSSVLELAGANAIELAEAADIVTNTMNMFEISIEDLNRVNDVLSSTTAKSATNLTDLYEALKYSAPTANLFGIQIEEVNAALGVLANQGIKGSQAGTTLRNVLNSLVKPSRQAADILANLGIDEVSIKLDGLLGTLEKLKGLNIEDFVRVFGKEFGGITKALVDRGDLTAGLKSELDNSMGEAARMFNQGAGSFNVAIDNFKSAFEGAMIKMFDNLKPILTKTINWFTDLVKILSDGKSVAAGLGAGLVTAVGGFLQSTYKNSRLDRLQQVQDYRKELHKVIEENNKIKAYNADIEKQRDLLEEAQTILEEGFFKDVESTEYTKLNGITIDAIRDLQEILGDTNFSNFKDLKDYINSIDTKELNRAQKILASIKEKMHFDFPTNVHDIWFLQDSINAEILRTENSIQKLNKAAKAIRGENGEFYITDPKEKERLEQIDQALVVHNRNLEWYKQKLKEVKSIDVKQLEKFSGALHRVDQKFSTLRRELEKPLPNLQKQPTLAAYAWNNLAKGANKAWTAVKSFFGGGWMMAITAVTAAVTYGYGQWRKLGEAVREANEAVEKAKADNDKLGYSFRTLVTELAAAEKGSIAWQSRLTLLQREYPELVDELRLSEVYLNSTSDAFRNLASSMDEVINRQKQLNLAEAVGAARDKINKQYLESDYGDFGRKSEYTKRFEEVMKRVPQDMKGAMEVAFFQIGQILTGYVEGDPEVVKAKKIEEIAKILRDDVAKRGLGMDDAQADKYAARVSGNLYSNYMKRAGDAINNLPKINGDTFKTNLSDDLSKYVYKALERLNNHTANVMKDAELKFSNPEEQASYIEEETQRFASQLLDEILSKFKNVEIDGKDFREILKMDANFAEIVNAARRKADDIGTPDPEAEAVFGEELEEAKKEYIKELYAIAEEYHRGYIDEEEFQKKKLDALNSLINVYRQHGDILGKEYALYQANLFELNKVINDRTAAEKRAAEKAEKQYQIDIDRRDAGRDFKAIMNSPFEMGTLFDSTQLLEARLGHLKGQLEDLKSLRTSIADMDGLADMTTELDSAIAKLTTHVGELAEKFRQVQIDDFKKQVKDMRKDLDIASYDTFVGFNQGIVSIVDACRTLDKLGDSDMEGWERFVTGFQAVISITDTLVSTAESIRSFGKMLEEFGKAKEVLSGAESGSNLKNIAAIEAEAGAVVAAEATKIGAIEGKAAANITAKLAEIKAAEALMAAESAAAYAGIPFAGVGLAAAQIAELKALIAASAAFANGGIVGGTSTVGDRVLARVNSGEMILNKRQQGNLFSLLNSGSTGGGTSKVEFKLKGSELVGVLNNYNGKMNKLR